MKNGLRGAVQGGTAAEPVLREEHGYALSSVHISGSNELHLYLVINKAPFRDGQFRDQPQSQSMASGAAQPDHPGKAELR